MFRSLLQSYRKLVKELSRAQMDDRNVSSEDLQEDEVQVPLEDACGQINIYLREDGEFAIACDFTEYNDEIAEMAGMMLHMINSGNLAEYFIKSLKIWSKNDIDKEKLTKATIQHWRQLFYETSSEELASVKGSSLAVDPSDVFGLKRIK